MANGAGTVGAFAEFENAFRDAFETRAFVSTLDFNQAINGAIVMETDATLTQDFERQTTMPGLTDMDLARTDDNTPLAQKHYADVDQYSVRMKRTTPAVYSPKNAWFTKGMNPALQGIKAGNDAAKSIMERSAQIGVAALIGMASQTDWPYTIPGQAALSSVQYFRARQKRWFDNQQGHAATIMASGAEHDVLSQQVTDGSNLYDLGGLAIRTGKPLLGNVPVMVTDVDGMSFNDGTDDRYRTLLLKPGALYMKQTRMRVEVWEDKHETNNTMIGFKLQYELLLQPGRAFTVNKANMGSNPDVADLLAAANWVAIDTSTKNWPIVLMTSVVGT